MRIEHGRNDMGRLEEYDYVPDHQKAPSPEPRDHLGSARTRTALRSSAAIVVTLLAGITCRAGERTHPPERRVCVCIRAGGDTGITHQAQYLAAQMFLEIGVRIDWHNNRGSCRIMCRRPIVITISTDTPADLDPGWLAYSLPFEGAHIGIFYDRVRTAATPAGFPYLLGHVIAHEITHIVQGTDYHAEEGLMKGKWNGTDYQEMTRKHLPFSELDVQLINKGLDARESGRENEMRDTAVLLAVH
jgi:hypothetical protein